MSPGRSPGAASPPPARYAAREPQFRDLTDRLTAAAIDIAGSQLRAVIHDERWEGWASQLVPTVAIEAVIAWSDAGQPDPDHAAGRISRAVHGIVDAARLPAEE